MANIASAANGYWDDTGTWSGGTVPGNGDTVTQTHNLIVRDARTIGTSDVTGTAAITMTSANKTLTIEDGGTLTLRGDYIYKGQFAVYTKSLRILAGGILVFDSSQAAAPTTTYYRCRPDAGGTGASISIEGVVGNRCSVSSVSGSGKGYFDRNGFASIGQFFAEYCDFTRIGDAATRYFYDIFHGSNGITGTQSVTLHFNVFDDCGQLNSQNNANSGCNHSINNNRWKNSNGTRCIALPGFTIAGTKDFKNNVCDKDVFLGDGAWDTTDTMYFDGYTIGSRSVAAIQVRNFIRKTTQPTTNLAGDISDYILLKDGTYSNPHGLSCAAWNRVFTIENGILAYTGSNTNGDAISAGNPASARQHIVRGNVMLPNASGESWGKFISMGGGANVSFSVRNNTFPSNVVSSPGSEVGISYGETYAGHAAIYPDTKDNLAFSPTAGRAVIQIRHTGSVQLTTGADTTNNGTWNGYAGSDGTGYHSHSAGTQFSGTAPGTGDVNVTSDPFADRTRDFASWDTSLGGPGTLANALDELAKVNDADWDPAYNFQDLYDYLRGGFVLTGAAGASFAGAASDGGDIGAMPYSDPGQSATLAIADSVASAQSVISSVGGIAATSAVASAIAAVSDIDATMGGLIADLQLAAAAGSAQNVSSALGGIVAAVSAAVAAGEAQDLSVSMGGVSATASIAEATAIAQAVVGSLGGLTASIAVAQAAANAQDLTGTVGGASAALAHASALAESLDVLITLGGLSSGLTVANAQATITDIVVALGDIVAALSIATTVSSANDLNAVLGGVVGQLTFASASAEGLGIDVDVAGSDSTLLTAALASADAAGVLGALGGVIGALSVATANAQGAGLVASLGGIAALLTHADSSAEARDIQAQLSGVLAQLQVATSAGIATDTAVALGGVITSLSVAIASAEARGITVSLSGVVAGVLGWKVPVIRSSTGARWRLDSAVAYHSRWMFPSVTGDTARWQVPVEDIMHTHAKFYRGNEFIVVIGPISGVNPGTLAVENYTGTQITAWWAADSDDDTPAGGVQGTFDVVGATGKYAVNFAADDCDLIADALENGGVKDGDIVFLIVAGVSGSGDLRVALPFTYKRSRVEPLVPAI